MTHRANHAEAALLALTAVFIAAVCVVTTPTARQFSALIGVVCFAGLLLRLIPYWHVMTSLERALGVLFTLGILIAAVGTYRVDQAGAAPSGVTWWIIAHRLLTLLAIASWPWWVGRTGTVRERIGKGLDRSV